MAHIRYHKILYYKYPATWVKIHLFKSERLFYFQFKRSLKHWQWFFHIQTPFVHFQKDNCNFVFGPSFLWWQLSLHFHW